MRRVRGWVALAAMALLAGCVAGCDEGTENSVAVVTERYCDYKAADEDQASNCFSYFLEHGLDRRLRHELYGPNAQAYLYAVGAVRGCLSRAGPLCEPATWEPVENAGRDVVARYCAYGSTSRSQLQGCLAHVTPSYVKTYRTNAARFAWGDLTRCLFDAGPLCRAFS